MSQIEDPELSSKFHGRLLKAAEDQKEYASIAEYLMGRAHQETFFVEVGEMDLEVRVATEGELLKLINLQASVVKKARGGYADDEEALDGIGFMADAYDQIYQMLGRLCVDEGLNYQFFASGQISSEDIGLIMGGILEHSGKKKEKISRFRKK